MVINQTLHAQVFMQKLWEHIFMQETAGGGAVRRVIIVIMQLGWIIMVLLTDVVLSTILAVVCVLL